jgi:acetyl esterase/lipase
MSHTNLNCFPLLGRAFLAGIFASVCLAAQTAAPSNILLWPQGAPGALGNTETDIPLLEPFPAPGPIKVPTAVIVCPGGGYAHLAITYEGEDVARWLNTLGISGFVLKYRLGPRYHHPIEIGDAQRAIRYVRAHAKELGIEPNRIGIWGFSAGGHLAASTGTHFDPGKTDSPDPIERESSRPDFMILAYPVITMKDPYAHAGSRTNLLGNNPDPSLVELLSNELQVKPDTPPAFLFHTTEDKTVPVENSVEFYLALRKAGVPAEMHIYLKGRHGVGLAPNDPVLSKWPGQLADWLKIGRWR